LIKAYDFGSLNRSSINMPSDLLGNGMLVIFGNLENTQFNEQDLNDWCVCNLV
jgi:hypothetical protein